MQATAESARIPTLDGWRGVSILLVLLSHAALYSRFHNLFWAQQGRTAVDIFFLISGYIITARLLDEGDDLNLPAFYYRRAFRILPPVALYLFVIAALSALRLIHGVTPSELLSSLLFFRNYHLPPSGGIYTGHFWSLAIEEHFYLLWPGLLAFLRPRRALYAASIGAIACALWRHHCFAAAAPSGSSLYFISLRTDCRLDGLLIGCCLAILTSSPSASALSVRSWIRRNVPKETPILCGFPAIYLLTHSRGLPSLWLYLVIAIALGATLFAEPGLVHKFLNLRPLAWIGRISFGLYVYQQVFLLHPTDAPIPHWQLFPLNLLLLFAVATLSYYFFERPISRIAHNLFPALPAPRPSFVTPVGNQEAT